MRQNLRSESGEDFKEKIGQAIQIAKEIEIICERNLVEVKEKNGETKQNFSNQAH
ncbi:MAG: hypothetical protein AABX54_01260 [Nanoarchaeota archaeon]